MIVNFTKIYLKELYETGKCQDKKHRFPPQVIKGFKKAIDYLKMSSRKEDLFTIVSLNFEALKGDKKVLYSVRANNKYRIEFAIREVQDEIIFTICDIYELSNHYG